MEEFAKLKVHPKLLEGIKLMGISVPTQIQEKCIPEIKAGKDVVGQSLTGSGKTAAFGLPILEKVIPGNGIQALILTPTRELCVQVRDHLDQMSKFLPINVRSIYGGVGYHEQRESIKIAEIIVATPGRLLDHIGQRNIDLSTVKFVVLDEADKMFEMGFEKDVDKILSNTSKERQTIMFSATMPRAAQNIITRYLKKPVYIQEKLHIDRSLLKQVFYAVRKEQKFSLLVHLLKEKTAGPAIVFCGTKRTVDAIAKVLNRNNIGALPVHGDLTQGKRNFAVNSFKNAKVEVLVATDVAARGLDIKDVSHVYNYDVPKTPEDYTHRIGRTARAGKKGDAVTLVSERDVGNFNGILRTGKMQILEERLPSFEEIPFGRSDSFERRGHRQNSNEFRSNREHRSFGSQRSYPSRGPPRGPPRGPSREHSGPRREYGNSSRGYGGGQREYNSEQRAPSEYARQRSYAPERNYIPEVKDNYKPQEQTDRPQENYEQEYDALRKPSYPRSRTERYNRGGRGNFRNKRNDFGHKSNGFDHKPRFNTNDDHFENKRKFNDTQSKFGHKSRYSEAHTNSESKPESFGRNKSFSHKKFGHPKSFGRKTNFHSKNRSRE